MTKLNREVLLDVAAVSSNSNWYPLDYICSPGNVSRSFVGELTTGDTIDFMVTNDDVRFGVSNVSSVCTVSSFSTTSFCYEFSGPWTAIQFRKNGTNGPAKITAIV